MKRFVILLLTLMGVLLVACTSISTPSPIAASTPTAIFAEYVGVDIQGLDQATRDRLQAEFDDLIKVTEESSIDRFHLWHIWQYEAANSKIRYILFEGQLLVMIPSASHARVTLLDDQWQVISTTTFSTGWRRDLESAAFVSEPSLDAQVIKVRSSLRGNKNNTTVQILGLADDRIVLARLEDASGQLLQNVYSYPNHTWGPLVYRTAGEWEQALQSTDPIEVLEALAWLSGHHLDPSQVKQVTPDRQTAYEDPHDAQTVATVRSDSGVRDLITNLTHSKNPWIAEAAQLATHSKWDVFYQVP